MRRADALAHRCRGWLAINDHNVEGVNGCHFVTLDSGMCQRFELLVPDNHPDAKFKARPSMLARFLNFMPPAFAIDYEVKVGNALREEPVHHWQLLKLELLLGRETLPGDSGSPVVAWNNDGSCTLVGMHIAGAGSWAYAIPSWRLFDLENFWKAPPGSRMRPVNP